MRTVFEDTNEAASRENPRTGQSTPIFLWIIAILCLFGSFAVYKKVASRKVAPPPPPVAVNDPKQVNETIYKFNQLIKEGDFNQAQAMLSADAQKKLTESNTTLHDSLLAQRKGKDDKVIEAVPLTENVVDLTDTSVTIGCTYYFAKNETIYLPLTIIKEKIGDTDRLAIAAWEKPEEKKDEKKDAAAETKPAENKLEEKKADDKKADKK
ncbi:MAG: hypothetical protein U0Y68_10580 [Blastocatellia bacterium]